MRRTDRLFALIETLSDGALHRAEDLAQAHRVSLRTLYRDIARLQAAGTPITGTRGHGYRLSPATVLPPLTLTEDEVEALHLGLAILLQSTDPDLRATAEALTAKVDAALPETTRPDATLWQQAENPFADAGKGLSHLPTLRAAIKARQKITLVCTAMDGTVQSHLLHPQALHHHARTWVLSGYSETMQAAIQTRLDLITSAAPRPELF
jgi:predicted DNA-binding transcriptional regulator YafY